MLHSRIKKGETIIEVLTAISAIVISGIASVSVIISAFQTTTISREYLIAQNLARETIEAVTNIRDSNWLNYPSKKHDCWLIIDGDCETGTSIETYERQQSNINYSIDRDPVVPGKFRMMVLGTEDEFDINLERDLQAIAEGKYVDLANSPSGLFRMFQSSDGVYSHDYCQTCSPADFFRRVRVTALDDGSTISDKAKISVKIQWLSSGSYGGTYEVSSIITNYAK